jgi:Flp pilus assembly protein TadB
MKEDILSVQKMKHKLVTFYLLLLVVACFCQVAVKKEGIAACPTYSLNCLDAAKSTNQGLPIPYEFTSLTQSTNSTESPGQQALAIGLSIALVICCCCTCIIGIVITIVIVACVGFTTVLAVFSPCLVALGCGACVGPVGGATVWLVEPLGELLEDQIEYNKDFISSFSIKTTDSC